MEEAPHLNGSYSKITNSNSGLKCNTDSSEEVLEIRPVSCRTVISHKVAQRDL